LGGLTNVVPVYGLVPTAMTAPAPPVVVTATATTHVAVPMSMTSAGKDNRAIDIANHGFSGHARHRRGG
jgi:hypothetical protein